MRVFSRAHKRRDYVVGLGGSAARPVSISVVRSILEDEGITERVELAEACSIVERMDDDWLRLSSEREESNAARERKRLAEKEAHEREAKERGLVPS